MCMGHHQAQRTWDNSKAWRPGNNVTVVPEDPHLERLYRPELLKTIEDAIFGLSEELRALSLDIHSHPELAFKERHAHDTYTAFMKKQGWNVQEHFHLDTAWEATYEHGQGGRVIGVSAEMDALPEIGHACGHNLIGMAGVAVSIGLRSALEKHDISGKIVLLGTPAEEAGNGKLALLEKGAYEGMDVCLMCHPAPGPVGSVSLSSSLAIREFFVQYEGHTAHAALSPWEGRNALDAAVLGYNNISALRQQLKPTHRVHGIFEGQDWAPNIIPDKAKFIGAVRAPTRVEMEETGKRVYPCFEAGALAAGCSVSIHNTGDLWDLRQNKFLGKAKASSTSRDEVANIILNKYGSIDYEWGINGASTDFGNVSYALPSLHPGYSIPTVPNGGNHTREFAKASSTEAAHKQTLTISIALAGTGMRVLTDDAYFAEVRRAFEEDEEIHKLR